METGSPVGTCIRADLYIYWTGQVRHGYRGTYDEASKLQKAIFLKPKAGVT